MRKALQPNALARDGMRPQGCGHRKEHQVFAYAAGHTLTGLGAPFDLGLDDISKRDGASVPIQRSPATFTGTDIVTITQVVGAIR